MIKRILPLFVVWFLTSGFIGGFSSNAPEAWDVWEENNPQNSEPIDHSAWDELLKNYIRTDNIGLNRFAYGEVTSEDKQKLENYLDTLSKIQISDRSRSVQFAYWVNMYNALTIKVILDNYPVKSIRDIDSSGLFTNGPWGAELIDVEGETLTLDDIEHAILRPIWKDPRIHYAVNCASIGCPNLQKTAFTAENTETLLEKGARNYVNSSRGLLIKNEKVTVSKIYKWFAYDFGNSEKSVIEHLKRYASSDKAKKLRVIGSISDTNYDWSLNE